MQFLLFLSAMLAGLTGLVSGDRAVAPSQVEQAIAAAAALGEASPARAEAAAHVLVPGEAEPRHARSHAPAPAAPLAHRASVDERRLE